MSPSRTPPGTSGALGAWRAPLIGFVLAGSALILMSLLTYRSAELLATNQRSVAHTFQVLNTLASSEAATRDAEATLRGVLLVQDMRYLDGIGAEVARARQFATQLVELTQDNPVQLERTRALASLIADRLQVVETGTRLARDGDLEGARRVLVDAAADIIAGKASGIGDLIGQIESEERRLLDARSAQSDRSGSIMLGAFVVSAVLTVGLLLLLGRAVHREAALQNQAEDEIRRANQELEHRVEERTRALSEANTELEGFAHSVAHDLRGPLRNMQGFARALLDDYGERLDDTGRTYAERIAYGAARLDALIQDLLSYSRISRTRIDLTAVDLGRLVHHVLQDLEADIAAAGARIEIEEPLPVVRAHAPVLGQVLANLVTNSIKFVAKGVTPLVSIRARTQGRTVRISVVDNGIGIEPRYQERIFGVFERLYGQDQYPGTGIGLAIVRKGIERMDGRVGVESAPDLGSEFWIELTEA